MSDDDQGSEESEAASGDETPEASGSESEESKPAARKAAAGDDDSRRKFLATACCGLGAGVAAIAAVPAVPFVAYPLSHETTGGAEGFLPAGIASRFKEGVPVKVDLFADRTDAWNKVENVKVGSAWVVRVGKELRAYSTVCPHLGCAVDFEGEGKKFKCPCHRSAFQLSGEATEGPSPRPLDALDVEEKDGKVGIKYARFKQGIAEKEQV